MFFQKKLRKKAKKKIRKFLIKQQKRNEKMGQGSDPCGFRESAAIYANAVKEFDRENYDSTKKIVREELKEMKRIKRLFGKDIAAEEMAVMTIPFVKELFAC
ncbi:MAG: hypothetical protein HYT94_00315 [Parcubacteria group bacterium]|nr:hypothetical protein [Parcubacteria group bacterium]